MSSLQPGEPPDESLSGASCLWFFDFGLGRFKGFRGWIPVFRAVGGSMERLQGCWAKWMRACGSGFGLTVSGAVQDFLVVWSSLHERGFMLAPASTDDSNS